MLACGQYYALRRSYGAARVSTTVVGGRGRGRFRGLLNVAGDAMLDLPYTAADNLKVGFSHTACLPL